MCLSTIYKNNISPANIIMENVSTIEFKDNVIILKDLMERKKEIKGTISSANLVDGDVIINCWGEEWNQRLLHLLVKVE